MSAENKRINEERVKKYCKNFTAEEFACGCGGRYCDGHPDTLDGGLLANLQRVRDRYGKEIVVTSGLRCQGYNDSLSGSIPTSKHRIGLAVDFYIRGGQSDSVSGRNAVMAYVRTLPKFNYTYGNTPGMGNAIHMDFANFDEDEDENAPSGIAVDGVWGVLTTKALQRKLGVSPDGIMGPDTIKALQGWINR